MKIPSTILLALLLVTAPGLAQVSDDAKRRADGLFEEAQRFQLGANRPVDIQRAYELYLEVTQLDAGHTDAFYNLAGLCFEHKRYDLAAKYYMQVIKLDPEDGHAYNNLGSVYEKQGKLQRARRLYVKAVQVDTSVAVAYYNLARMLFRDGKHEEALVQLNRALALEPDNAVFVAQQSRLAGELGKISNTAVVVVVGVFVTGLATYALIAAKKGGLA